LSLTDALPAFLKAQLAGVVGLKNPTDAIEGKWKVRQNRPEGDHQGVADGLHREAGPEAMTRLLEGKR
jgi:transcriptional regulator